MIPGILLVFLLGCTSQKGDNSYHVDENHHKAFSASYHPPAFENDVRAEKVSTLQTLFNKLIDDYRDSHHIPGVAYGIVVDDRLVLSSATGTIHLEENRPATTASSFRIASMSKSFTAMAILKLRDEGALSLEDPAEKYIPEMSQLEYLTSDSPRITLQHLLTMTAGLPEDNPWGDRQLAESDQKLLELAGGLSFSNPPAYAYEYSNTGYAILGHIISAVSGMTFQDYIRENILLPLQMEHTYWEIDSVPGEQLAQGYRWEDDQWKQEPMLHDGSYGAMGGLITSIEDFSKYVSYHLSAWPPRNDPDTGPVKRSTLREMQSPHYNRIYTQDGGGNDQPCAMMTGYGCGLRITEDCQGLKSVGHGGALPGFGSNYVFFPEYGIGMMAFCNLTYTSPWPLEEIMNLLFDSEEIEKRSLPASDILLERQGQIVKLIQTWDAGLEEKILAENFYLDKSRDLRLSEIREILDKAGTIEEIEKMNPENQLRGSFNLQATNGEIRIFFTLTPEKDPKVQQLEISYRSAQSEG